MVRTNAILPVGKGVAAVAAVTLVLAGAAVPGTAQPPAQPAAARVTVHLPAEALLYVEGVLSPLTSGTRTFTSPPLNPAKEYVYTLRAEVVRGGKVVTAVKKVDVKAGASVTVDFGDLREGVEKAEAAKTAADFPLSGEEQAVLDLTNQERKNAGLPPLKPNGKLFKAARLHSENMARKDQLGHVLDGKGPDDRMRDAGYTGFGWGENCAGGQRTAAEAMASWMSSAGHRANILNGSFGEIGVGVASTTAGTRYWTQVFATPAR